MAFIRANFQPLGGQSNAGLAPALWGYKTDDAHATVDVANYFDDVRGLMHIGDLIYVAVMTNLGADNEALSTAGFHALKDKSTTHVDVTDVTVITVTDSR